MYVIKVITTALNLIFAIILIKQLSIDILNHKKIFGTAMIVLVYISSIICMWS